MSRSCRLAWLVFLVPGWTQAQEVPERHLSEGTQVYFRWDGMAAHRAAFQKTALGQILQGDLGTMLTGLYGQFKENLGPLLTTEQLLGGVPPERLEKIKADAVEVPKLLEIIGNHGFLLGVEIKNLEPPDGEVMVIFPQAGVKPDSFLATGRLAASLAEVKLKEVKARGRTVFSLEAGPVRVSWWIEGHDAVLVVGTASLEALGQRLKDGRPDLTGHLLFKKMLAFKEFETGTRSFVDVPALVKLARTRGPEVNRLIDDLGLAGIKSLLVYSGFDGPAERGLVELDAPGPRKGLLRLATAKTFKLSDLPSMPADVISFSASTFDWGVLYDTGVNVVEAVLRLVAPEQAPMVKDALKLADTFLGINIRQDLLAQLGPLTMQYVSPSDGILGLGQVTLIQVKDAKKLQEVLENVFRTVGNLVGAEGIVKKKMYRGVELREVHLHSPGFFYLPTYTIHKNWLIFSLYPQPLQGYVLRSIGQLPVWRPSKGVQGTLEQFPREFVSLSVSDPRPGVMLVLNLIPLIGTAVNNFLPDSKFDVSSVPNTLEVTRYLFPNVTIRGSSHGRCTKRCTAVDTHPREYGCRKCLIQRELVAPKLRRRSAETVNPPSPQMRQSHHQHG